MKTRTQLGWILALALGSSAAANADTVDLFDNLNLSSWGSGSPLPTGWVANQFTTGGLCPGGCTLGNVTLYLNTQDELLDFTTAGYKLDITSANTVGLPGSVIGTMNFPAEFLAADFEMEFTPQGDIALQSNTTYWVKLTADDNSTLSEWLFEPTPSGPEFWAVDNGSGIVSPIVDPSLPNNRQMMKVTANASPVPIPAAFWLMGTALVGLVAHGRRRTV